MIVVDHATPATPAPSLPRAPTIPDTCVPCPGLPPAAVTSLGLLSLVTKSQPWTSSLKPLPSSSTPLPETSLALVQMFGARSPAAMSAPVSTTPTTTFGLPVVRSQAPAASMSSPAAALYAMLWLLVGTLWPVLLRPQSLPNRLSL